MDGDDGDIAMRQCPFIAIFGRVLADEFARQPPIGTALRIDAFLKAVVPAGIGLVADTYAFDLILR